MAKAAPKKKIVSRKTKDTIVYTSETIEEFFARGGVGVVLPSAPLPETSQSICIKTKIDYDLMSLGEGEFMFGSKRNTKQKPKQSKEEVCEILNNSGLPVDMIEYFKKSLKNK
jgi:hypothetical protein